MLSFFLDLRAIFFHATMMKLKLNLFSFLIYGYSLWGSHYFFFDLNLALHTSTWDFERDAHHNFISPLTTFTLSFFSFHFIILFYILNPNPWTRLVEDFPYHMQHSFWLFFHNIVWCAENIVNMPCDTHLLHYILEFFNSFSSVTICKRQKKSNIYKRREGENNQYL